MKKQLTLLLISLLSYQVYSLDLMQNRFNGSSLCNNLSMTYYVPDSLQTNYIIEYTVQKSDTSNYLFINYLFKNDSTSNTKTEKIEIDLNNIFPIDEAYSYNNVKWMISEKETLNGIDIRNELPKTSVFPYNQCIESAGICGEIIIIRKTLRDICPQQPVITQIEYSIKEDSIIVHFNDSSYIAEMTCQAIGKKIKTDSLIINTLESKNYTIYKKGSNKGHCPLPCPDYKVIYSKINKFDMRQCIINQTKEFTKEHKPFIFQNSINNAINLNRFGGILKIIDKEGINYFTNRSDT